MELGIQIVTRAYRRAGIYKEKVVFPQAPFLMLKHSENLKPLNAATQSGAITVRKATPSVIA